MTRSAVSIRGVTQHFATEDGVTVAGGADVSRAAAQAAVETMLRGAAVAPPSTVEA